MIFLYFPEVSEGVFAKMKCERNMVVSEDLF